MPNSNEIIGEQLNELVATGSRIVNMVQNAPRMINATEAARVSSWASSGNALINSICSRNSPYISMYSNALLTQNFYNIHANHCAHVGVIKGILESVKQDFEKGLLNVDNRITTEVFADFLEMADYLIEQGLKDPAASIIGAVLEDALRKLAVSNNIPLVKDNGSAKTIEPLNQDLYSAHVYEKLIFKQITSWADVRNNAAHGHYDCFDLDQVKMMMQFVEKFCSDYLGQ